VDSRYRVSIEVCLVTIFFLMLAYSTAKAKTCFIMSGSGGLEKDKECKCLKTKKCATVTDPLAGVDTSKMDTALVNTIKQTKIAADAAMRGDIKGVDKAVEKINDPKNLKKVEELFRKAKADNNEKISALSNTSSNSLDVSSSQVGEDEAVVYKYKVMDIADSSVPIFKAISSRYMKALFPYTISEMEKEDEKSINPVKSNK